VLHNTAVGAGNLQTDSTGLNKPANGYDPLAKNINDKTGDGAFALLSNTNVGR